MRETVIVEAVRTPVGKRNGGLSGFHAADLSALVLQRTGGAGGYQSRHHRRRGLGLRSQVGDQSSNIGRYSVLAAGWPRTHPRHHGQPGMRVQSAGPGFRGAGRDARASRTWWSQAEWR